MTDENSIQTFYKHNNTKKEIGWSHHSDIEKSGPSLNGALSVLTNQGLRCRSRHWEQAAGWSGDLYVVHRRLFNYQDEMARFMGDSGTGGKLVANVLDVVIDSTDGWGEYLSVVLKGPFKEEVAKQLADMDFAPKHSYLTKNDSVARYADGGLWLESIVEFPSIVSKAK